MMKLKLEYCLGVEGANRVWKAAFTNKNEPFMSMLDTGKYDDYFNSHIGDEKGFVLEVGGPIFNESTEFFKLKFKNSQAVGVSSLLPIGSDPLIGSDGSFAKGPKAFCEARMDRLMDLKFPGEFYLEPCKNDGKVFPENTHEVEYVLLSSTPLEKMTAFLFKRTQDDIALMGRVTLDVDKMAGWAEKLINRDLQIATHVGEVKSESPLTPEYMAANVLAQIKEIARVGLKEAYSYNSTHAEAVSDMSADLPWDEAGRERALKWLLEQGEFGIAENLIKVRDGVSYRDALTDIASELECSVTGKDPRWTKK